MQSPLYAQYTALSSVVMYTLFFYIHAFSYALYIRCLASVLFRMFLHFSQRKKNL